MGDKASISIEDVNNMSLNDLSAFSSSLDIPPSAKVDAEEGESLNKDLEKKEEEKKDTSEESDLKTEDMSLQKTDDKTNEEQEETSFEDFFKAVTAPLKALGKELSFDNPEDIRTLVQKGIGYEHQMGKLKKFQRHLETLDKQNLLEENTLNLIIDLAQGKPEALKQYIEKNKIDIYQVIGLEDDSYEPEKHIPSEEDFEKTKVVEEVKSLEGYNLIQDIVEKSWDNDSQQKILADPELADNLIRTVKAGLHDMISTEAEKVKVLANAPMTDLEAYVTAVNKLNSRGAFDKMIDKSSNVDEAIKPKNLVTKGKPASKATTLSMEDVSKMSVEELENFAEQYDL